MEHVGRFMAFLGLIATKILPGSYKLSVCVCVCVFVSVVCVCPGGAVQPSSPAGRLCPVGITCHGAESLIDASCFSGAIIAPKCQDLICDFVMWTHGPEEGVTRLLRRDSHTGLVSRCEGLEGYSKKRRTQNLTWVSRLSETTLCWVTFWKINDFKMSTIVLSSLCVSYLDFFA